MLIKHAKIQTYIQTKLVLFHIGFSFNLEGQILGSYWKACDEEDFEGKNY